MIEAKFEAPQGFILDSKIQSISEQAGSILGSTVKSCHLSPQPRIPGYNCARYAFYKDGDKSSIASINYDTDAITVDRKGNSICVCSASFEQEIYKAILNILGLKDET